MAKLSDERRQRLADIATAWRDARQTVTVQRRKLQDAVMEAIDTDGASTGDVAAAIGLSRTRVYEIITGAYKD
jgi:Spy/CpxP family protein refolding chaperone